MTWTPRRTTLALACAAGTLALSGCSVTGTASLHDDGTASVDVVLVLSSQDDDFCTDAPAGLTVGMLPSDAGKTSCRVTADRVPGDRLTSWFGLPGRGDGFYYVGLSPVLLGFGNDLAAIDLTLGFPGPVLAASGASAVTWNTVRWTDPEAVVAEGLMVVALDHAGIPVSWLVAGGLGTVVPIGVAVGFAALTRARRRRVDSGVSLTPLGQADAATELSSLRDDGPVTTRPESAPFPPAAMPGSDDPEIWSRD